MGPDPDFSGWATKAGLECSDGRTIMPDAFKHQDGKKVPLVWGHGHSDPELVLGHAILKAHPEGMRFDAYLNDGAKAKATRTMVEHEDVNSVSIYANQLVERSKQVFHGFIKELSVVLAGANPGALIDFVRIAHSEDPDDFDLNYEAATIYTGLPFLGHEDNSSTGTEEAPAGDESGTDGNNDGEDGKTVQEVYDEFTEEQKDVVHYIVGEALAEKVTSAEHSGINNGEGDLNNTTEGTGEMTHNLFEDGADGGSTKTEERRVLSHSDIAEIKENWKRGGSMRQAVQDFAVKHGIENLDSLFPDPKAVPDDPQWDKRRTEWVASVLNGTKHSPFSRIKTLWADITHEEARARGYIKGNLKKEEFFGLTKRTTRPTTIYKKQKLDRDDILDATELNVVAWMKAEMRMMLEEECARAILIGDGRPVEDPNNVGEPNPDKIKDPAGVTDGEGIRSILNDHELFAATVNVATPAAGASYQPVVEDVMIGMELYKGSGSPTMYATRKNITRMLLSKDGFGRRLWRTRDELASEMGVSSIQEVEVMESVPDVLAIIVNLQDYNVGTDAGGEVNLFDDFDLDYNQYKYLIETRFSGALVKIRSAIIVKLQDADDDEVEPLPLAFNPATNTIDYVAQTGVSYTIDGTPFTTDQVITEDTVVKAVPAAGYYFPNNIEDEWFYEFNPDA